ncbi:hypothetical protein CDAR_409971 [Caerostris darwini]|uniref:Uncharacterized protein n=1 Tax=Caerostris darwini TaxID=1538125 RepID=A0AAV4VW79_9ARAC|nr:hypothetical protein CDAR_409971 [Caerostris darwini]
MEEAIKYLNVDIFLWKVQNHMLLDCTKNLVESVHDSVVKKNKKSQIKTLESDIISLTEEMRCFKENRIKKNKKLSNDTKENLELFYDLLHRFKIISEDESFEETTEYFELPGITFEKESCKLSNQAKDNLKRPGRKLDKVPNRENIFLKAESSIYSVASVKEANTEQTLGAFDSSVVNIQPEAVALVKIKLKIIKIEAF